MKKFVVEWNEIHKLGCSVVIEASSMHDAMEKFHNGEYDQKQVREEIDFGADIDDVEIRDFRVKDDN